MSQNSTDKNKQSSLQNSVENDNSKLLEVYKPPQQPNISYYNNNVLKPDYSEQWKIYYNAVLLQQFQQQVQFLMHQQFNHLTGMQQNYKFDGPRNNNRSYRISPSRRRRSPRRGNISSSLIKSRRSQRSDSKNRNSQISKSRRSSKVIHENASCTIGLYTTSSSKREASLNSKTSSKYKDSPTRTCTAKRSDKQEKLASRITRSQSRSVKKPVKRNDSPIRGRSRKRDKSPKGEKSQLNKKESSDQNKKDVKFFNDDEVYLAQEERKLNKKQREREARKNEKRKRSRERSNNEDKMNKNRRSGSQR